MDRTIEQRFDSLARSVLGDPNASHKLVEELDQVGCRHRAVACSQELVDHVRSRLVYRDRNERVGVENSYVSPRAAAFSSARERARISSVRRRLAAAFSAANPRNAAIGSGRGRSTR